MTAPLVTPLGTRYTDSTVEAGSRKALTHLARPIRHNRPGTLWERVEESGADLVTINGWLAIDTGQHNCAGGTIEAGYAHERGCGLEPLYHFGGVA